MAEDQGASWLNLLNLIAQTEISYSGLDRQDNGSSFDQWIPKVPFHFPFPIFNVTLCHLHHRGTGARSYITPWEYLLLWALSFPQRMWRMIRHSHLHLRSPAWNQGNSQRPQNLLKLTREHPLRVLFIPSVNHATMFLYNSPPILYAFRCRVIARFYW